MKKLEELGISPAPWRYIGYHNHKSGVYIHLGEVKFADKRKLCYDISQPNARLIAAAPELYECLREAVIEMCHNCLSCKGKRNADKCSLKEDEGKCFIQKWRKVLAKAAGEEETK